MIFFYIFCLPHTECSSIYYKISIEDISKINHRSFFVEHKTVPFNLNIICITKITIILYIYTQEMLTQQHVLTTLVLCR